MMRTHQPGQTVFRSVLPEDIDWKSFPAFPPPARLAVVAGQPTGPGPYVIQVKVPSRVKLGAVAEDRITPCGSPAPRGFTGYEHCDRTISSHARAGAASRRVRAMTLPEGLIYVPGFLTEAEERDVLAVLATFELHPYVLHDTPSRRLVRSFGLALGAGAYDAGPAAPVPAELEWLRERCAALMGREPEELADLLVTRYPPGAGIGWHRDAPQFGEVSGISLQAASRMRFRRGRPRAWETAELTLEPRSAYVLSGPARAQWQHHIPPITQERWSTTFRTLRHAAAGTR